ncbi:MAG TPA: CDP-glucose 4,6-dehydratase, partial [Chthoniobacterales bacterium]
LDRTCVAIFITTDKCYENREWLYAYREDDALGGYDPYSSSKAAAEIAIAAFRRSFFHPSTAPRVKIASARAGNVIGGGDWALDRIVPDSMRSLQGGEAIPVRNKGATRPWQHVLEPLSGYLSLGARIATAPDPTELCSAFNFGPALRSNRSVEALVRELLANWPGEWVDNSDPNAVHEAGRLNLAIERAFHLLAWSPVWQFEETIAKTVEWYRFSAEAGNDSARLREFTLRQIEQYVSAARGQGLTWAQTS